MATAKKSKSKTPRAQAKAKKPASKKSASKKPAAKKPAAKKTVSKKPAAKKTTAKKTAAKKPATKKSASKKTAAKKPAARKSGSKSPRTAASKAPARKPDAASIEQQILIAAEPEVVYETLMDSSRHSAFTSSAAVIDPNVGGEFTAWDGYIKGRNLDLLPGERIVQEWVTTEWPEDAPPSRVEFHLERTAEGTRLRMVHSEVPPSQLEQYRQGWVDFYWDPLRRYFVKTD